MDPDVCLLVGLWVVRIVGWSVGRCLVGWSVGKFVGWLASFLVGRLVDWFQRVCLSELLFFLCH